MNEKEAEEGGKEMMFIRQRHELYKQIAHSPHLLSCVSSIFDFHRPARRSRVPLFHRALAGVEAACGTTMRPRPSQVPCRYTQKHMARDACVRAARLSPKTPL